MGILERECGWYCNHCASSANQQKSSFGLWQCAKCNHTGNKSDDLPEEEFAVFSYIVCPRCSTYMDTDNYEQFKCSHCGCTGTYNYESHYLIEDEEQRV